ncbi:MAG TPA: TIGR02594 family protein, partial [Devosia sp.]|nr:TIGR02594 family protein [Devosia sp.]
MIDPRYKWLLETLAANNGSPKMLSAALTLYGSHEVPGPGSNPAIMEMRKTISAISPIKATGVRAYTDDDIAWCGLFMAYCAHLAGKEFPDYPLWAMNWAGFGTKSPEPGLGDVLVFKRTNTKGQTVGGHVALYVGEDEACFHILGGNQSNSVTIMRKAKAQLVAARRPIYRVQPLNVRPFHLAATGAVTTN